MKSIFYNLLILHRSYLSPEMEYICMHGKNWFIDIMLIRLSPLIMLPLILWQMPAQFYHLTYTTRHLPPILQCFQKKYTSEFWRICCNCSMMKRFYGLSTEFFFFFPPSPDTGSSAWSSYNIFFKILRYTSSENTVVAPSNFVHTTFAIQYFCHQTKCQISWCLLTICHPN